MEKQQTEQVVVSLEKIKTLLEKVAGITRHLKAFAREAGAELSPVNLDLVIKDALDLMSNRLKEYKLVERLTVIENVLTGRLGYMSSLDAWRRRFNQQDINTAFELLHAVGLAEHAKERADSLSVGQRQRVGIARAVMQNPQILLADEPTSFLDPKTAVEIMELLERFSMQKNIPALVNIHDVTLASRFAKRIIGMSDGKIVYDGSPDGITDDHLKQVYGGESWLV
ncbi:ATP-binding cassette domain-containing protein [Reinekea sp.]|uniref:phosphonate ABC transporter ATP-binding protein n=1 Tax=Reinekea sp. TaxID=1970455 RepID=UPI0039C25B2B